MITIEQFEEVHKEAEEAVKLHPEWRKGQAFFNLLNSMQPATADYIRSTELDMFYNDDVIEKFKTAIIQYNDND